MRSASELSPKMREAVVFARGMGGGMKRLPGGYWVGANQALVGHLWFSTPTIEALVRRGWMRYVEWKQSGSGKFPIRTEVLPTDDAEFVADA